MCLWGRSEKTGSFDFKKSQIWMGFYGIIIPRRSHTTSVTGNNSCVDSLFRKTEVVTGGLGLILNLQFKEF